MTKDEATGLSRQRRWQLAKQKDGKCRTCGKRQLLTSSQCRRCSLTSNAVKLAKYHAAKTN